MERRNILLAGGACGALALVAALIGARGGDLEQLEAAPVVAGEVRPTQAPAARNGRGVLAAPAFEALPDEHQPDAIDGAMADVEGWFDEAWPEARGAWLGTDCSDPPCLIGVRFEPPEPARYGEIATAWREELERRLGWRPYGVLTAEDGDGVQHVWMFGMPEELLGIEHADRQQALVESAGQRFSRLVERAGIDPADPVRNE